MFVEGLVLHDSLYSFNGRRRLPFWLNYLIGWLLPALCVGVWVLLLELLPTESTGLKAHCWQGYGKSALVWTLTGPMLVALIANICFLINIVRVLVVKLRSRSNEDALPRALRATAFLIPLLGKWVVKKGLTLSTDRIN